MIVTSSRGAYAVDLVDMREVAACLCEDAVVITDQEVIRLYPDLLADVGRMLVLPPGEASKSLSAFGECLSWLAQNRVARKGRILALGGGVIGDLVGFVASAYMRGIAYWQIPTTLLAQVDSSVGGKVGIDLPEGKNLAGAFYPPQRVLVCSDFLRTLPERQFRNGMAEVLKYGFIADPSLLSTQPEGRDSLRAAVDRCIQIKSKIVEADEFETTGLRATLNFGHTVAHALEKVLGYKELLHGEAVAIGMVVETRLGNLMGITDAGASQVVCDVLSRAGLPTSHGSLCRKDELVESMYRDKKSASGTLTFSLLTEIGHCRIVSDVPEALVRVALRDG